MNEVVAGVLKVKEEFLSRTDRTDALGDKLIGSAGYHPVNHQIQLSLGKIHIIMESVIPCTAAKPVESHRDLLTGKEFICQVVIIPHTEQCCPISPPHVADSDIESS